MVVFLASAAAVWVLGAGLSKYGDALADLTGLGRLFVGSILVALATSLPELSTNISAVRLNPPNPDLAVGNVLGANMLDLFIFAMVALLFGGHRFLRQIAPEQGYLIVLAAAMTGLAVVFGALRLDAGYWKVGLSSVLLLVVYVVGMWVVYRRRPQRAVASGDGAAASGDRAAASGDGGAAAESEPSMTLGRAWLMFFLVSCGVIVAGIFLAWSTDRIADITGVASSTLGILAVSVITTLPELSAAVAAARMGAADLGVAGLFGSAVFNASILAYADPFYRGGILVNQAGPPHFVAGGVAVGLILAGLLLVLGRNTPARLGRGHGLGPDVCRLGSRRSGRDRHGSAVSRYLLRSGARNAAPPPRHSRRSGNPEPSHPPTRSWQRRHAIRRPQPGPTHVIIRPFSGRFGVLFGGRASDLKCGSPSLGAFLSNNLQRFFGDYLPVDAEEADLGVGGVHEGNQDIADLRPKLVGAAGDSYVGVRRIRLTVGVGMVDGQEFPTHFSGFLIHLHDFQRIHGEAKRAGFHIRHPVRLFDGLPGSRQNPATFVGHGFPGMGYHFVDEPLLNLHRQLSPDQLDECGRVPVPGRN